MTIDSSGVVYADLRVPVVQGLNEVALPVEPIPETIEVKADGRTLIPIYENRSLYFFSPSRGEAEICYLVNISARDGIFSFKILGENMTSLRISPQIILLSVPKRVESLEYVGEELLIKLYGPEEIEYAVKRPSAPAQGATTTMTTPPQTTAETTLTSITAGGAMITSPKPTTSITKSMATATTRPTSTTTQIPTMTTARRGGIIAIANYYWILVVIIALAAVSAIISSRKRRGEEYRMLSNVDRMILERIAEAGGSLLQGELQNELMLPKTTLWRHVKKLEKLGYIRIIKEGPFNRLILTRALR